MPEFGWVSYRNGHRIPGRSRAGRGKGRHALRLAGKAKSVTLSREGKHWFASILCEIEVAEPKPVQAPAVGVDLGVAQAMTTSTGEVLAVLGMTKAEERKKAGLQ